MEAIPLDPGPYTGTYKLVGGRLALDFVNTVSWPTSLRRHDWLDRPSNAVGWGVAVGVLPEASARSLRAALDADPAGASRDLRRLVALRSDLAAVLTPLAHDDHPGSSAIERLNQHLARVCRRRYIEPADLAWTWGPVDGLNDLHGPIVADAADIVTSGDHGRLGYCPSCAWLFLDTTRNRGRRWCTMDDCGSRDKALRYYRRRTGAVRDGG